MRSRPFGATIIMLLATLAVATLSVGAVGADRASRPAMVPASNAWGWVVARHPKAGAYVPAPRDRGNSSGAVNRIERMQTGAYLVTFSGITNGVYPVGTVTALSTGGKSCTIDDNGRNATDSTMSIYVDCFDRRLRPADARFSLTVAALGAKAGLGSVAYTWADQHTEPFYPGEPAYTFNSSSDSGVEIIRNGIGSYRIAMPGLGRSGGDAQVVLAQGPAIGTCRIRSVANKIDSEHVQVRCMDERGRPLDAGFMVIFTHRVGMTGTEGRATAYLLANRPMATSYRPAKNYRYSSAGKAPSVVRSGKGRYRVSLPGMPSIGSAQVSAYGEGNSICQLSAIPRAAKPQRIGVACFGTDGAARDAQFMLTYTR